MANAFLSEVKQNIATSAGTDVLTCGASTEITVIGLSVANTGTSQILIDVKLDASARTSGNLVSVFLVKSAPIPVGGSLELLSGNKVELLSGIVALLAETVPPDTLSMLYKSAKPLFSKSRVR